MFGIYCKFSYDHTLPVLISIIMIGNIVMFPSHNIHSFYYLYYEIIFPFSDEKKRIENNLF